MPFQSNSGRLTARCRKQASRVAVSLGVLSLFGIFFFGPLVGVFFSIDEDDASRRFQLSAAQVRIGGRGCFVALLMYGVLGFCSGTALVIFHVFFGTKNDHFRRSASIGRSASSSRGSVIAMTKQCTAGTDTEEDVISEDEDDYMDREDADKFYEETVPFLKRK